MAGTTEPVQPRLTASLCVPPRLASTKVTTHNQSTIRLYKDCLTMMLIMSFIEQLPCTLRHFICASLFIHSSAPENSRQMIIIISILQTRSVQGTERLDRLLRIPWLLSLNTERQLQEATGALMLALSASIHQVLTELLLCSRCWPRQGYCIWFSVRERYH